MVEIALTNFSRNLNASCFSELEQELPHPLRPFFEMFLDPLCPLCLGFNREEREHGYRFCFGYLHPFIFKTISIDKDRVLIRYKITLLICGELPLPCLFQSGVH